MSDEVRLSDYPFRSFDKLRYGDTDSQGHINNAVFSTLLETGRVEMVYGAEGIVTEPGGSLVIARLVLDFKGEMRWPGTVEIGTRVVSVGHSSITLAQALFQNERCVASAETVIVLIDNATRRSRPLSPETIARLREPRGDRDRRPA